MTNTTATAIVPASKGHAIRDARSFVSEEVFNNTMSFALDKRVRTLAKITVSEADTAAIVGTLRTANDRVRQIGATATVATARMAALLVHHNDYAPGTLAADLLVSPSRVSQLKTIGRVLDEIGIPTGFTAEQVCDTFSSRTKLANDVLKLEQDPAEPNATKYNTTRREMIGAIMRDYAQDKADRANKVGKYAPKSPAVPAIVGTPGASDDGPAAPSASGTNRDTASTVPDFSVSDEVSKVVGGLDARAMHADRMSSRQLASILDALTKLQGAVDAIEERDADGNGTEQDVPVVPASSVKPGPARKPRAASK